MTRNDLEAAFLMQKTQFTQTGIPNLEGRQSLGPKPDMRIRSRRPALSLNRRALSTTAAQKWSSHMGVEAESEY